MSTERHPAPGPTMMKPNGEWTFYVFPDGQQREAGVFASEAAAKLARVHTLLKWGANGEKYPSGSEKARLSLD